MRKKRSNQTRLRILTLFAVTFVAFNVVFCQYVLAYASSVSAAKERVQDRRLLSAAIASKKKPIGVPVRIVISRIAVDAAIEHVALAKDGSMDVPKDPMDAGWYEPGPRPGEPGSAVIAGHVDWFKGATGVFANLHKVKPGDVITIQDEAGAPRAFVVREIRTYGAAADAMDVFTSTDGRAHLNLITCGGTWDKKTKQYTKRLIVFTDLL